MRGRALARAVLLMLALAACTSPEATRLRAGGPGADVGNHGEVQLHSGADPFYGTPTVMPTPRGTSASASPRAR